MTPVHLALAISVVVIWGVAFVATRLALDDFSPPALTALRFLIAAVPVAFLPRPRIGARDLIVVGTFLFTGQFLFQFFGIAAGTPPRLAAVAVQTQGLFTILVSAPSPPGPPASRARRAGGGRPDPGPVHHSVLRPRARGAADPPAVDRRRAGFGGSGAHRDHRGRPSHRRWGSPV